MVHSITQWIHKAGEIIKKRHHDSLRYWRFPRNCVKKREFNETLKKKTHKSFFHDCFERLLTNNKISLLFFRVTPNVKGLRRWGKIKIWSLIYFDAHIIGTLYCTYLKARGLGMYSDPIHISDVEFNTDRIENNINGKKYK